MIETALNPSPQAKRTYIPAEFSITDWESLSVYTQQLLDETPSNQEELEALLTKVSEIEAVISEDRAWRYIRMTCDTENEELTEHFQYFVKEIFPQLSVFSDQLNRKLVAHAHFTSLPDFPYLTFKRALNREIELFREENIPIAIRSPKPCPTTQSHHGFYEHRTRRAKVDLAASRQTT